MRRVEALRELQAIDTALDQARARLGRIGGEWGRREAADATRAARDTAAITLRHVHVEQRDLELELEKLRAKFQANSERLYSGRVRGPRELEDLSKEVEQDRRLVSDREDRLIPLFDQVETAETAARQTAEAYQQAETAFERRQAELAAERRQVEAEGTRLTGQRAQVAAQADAASLRLYESLRRSRDGLAVVPVQQRTCQGCRITLPTSEEQQARISDDLVLCSSCGRILYAS